MELEKENANSPSIDRIDAKRGYTKDNIWIISKRANSIKTNTTVQEIVTVANSLNKISGSVDDIDKHNNQNTIPPELYVTLLSILKISSNNYFEILNKISELIANDHLNKKTVRKLEKENAQLTKRIEFLERRSEGNKNEIESLKNLLEIERMPLEYAA